MVFRTLPALFLCILQVSGVSVYVDGKNGISNETCCPNANNNSSLPCKNLTLALECVKGIPLATFVSIIVSKGNYILDEEYILTLMENKTVGFEIVGSCADCVRITCEKGAGFTFVKSSNIKLENLTFSGCGVSNNSTSKDGDDDFSIIKSTLYFLLCQNVTLLHITVEKTNGTGVVMYGTVGTNIISDSTFLANTPTDKEGGGGLYIEFPFCYPGNTSCFNGTPNVPMVYTSNSVYRITNCLFSNNQAIVSNAYKYTYILPQKSEHVAFGRGGGVSIFVKGMAQNNTISIDYCTFSNNTALWGGGLFVEMQDNSKDNVVTVSGADFTNNQCLYKESSSRGTGGGGSRIGFIFFNDTHCIGNSIYFKDTNFTENAAFFGGGISFYAAREPTETRSTNNVVFQNTRWVGNVARAGSGADLSVWHSVHNGATASVTINRCHFIGNRGNYTLSLGKVVGIGALYSDSIPITFVNYSYFENNTHSALAAVITAIYVSNNAVIHFVNNTGRHGGAVALLGDAFIQTESNSALKFINNTAVIAGGAIYHNSIGDHDLINSRNCFICYNDITITPDKWYSSFFFSGNRVNGRNESIFATSLLTCQWGGSFGNASEDLSKVFCWGSMWDYDGSNCTSEVRTSPAQYDVSNYNINVFPGQHRSMGLKMFDDRGSDVTNSSVFVVKSQSSELEIDVSSLYISDNHIDIHPPNSHLLDEKSEIKGKILVETIEPRVIQTWLNVTLLSCPPGMVLSESDKPSCQCAGTYEGVLLCNETDFRTKLQRGNWIGVYTRGNESKVVASATPYFSAKYSHTLYSELPRQLNKLNAHICDHVNRNGTLCGKCKKGYGPSIHTLKCVKCDAQYMWALYLVSQFLPLTLLFILVIVLDIRITSAKANAFIFFAQVLPIAFTLNGGGSIIYSPAGNYFIKVYTFLYNVWNLEFFQLPICLSPHISSLGAIAINYLEAAYPLVLIGVVSLLIWMYERGCRCVLYLCRPFHMWLARFQQRWNIQRSLIHAFASFILLSYSRFIIVSFLLLTTTPLIEENGDPFGPKYGVLFYDGTIAFMSEKHAPYFALALFFLLVFVFTTPLLLIIPSVWRNLNIISDQWPLFGRFCPHGNCTTKSWPKLGAFLEAFHGCYRDGTNTTRREVEFDYRWFAGAYLILRVILFAVYAFTPYWFLQLCLLQLFCTIALLAFTTLRPYKIDFYNKLDSAMFALLMGINTITMYSYQQSFVGSHPSLLAFSFQSMLVLLPLLYISIVFLRHLRRFWSIIKCCSPKAGEEQRRLLDDQHSGDPINDEGPLTQSGSHDYLSFMEETGRLKGVNMYRPAHSTIIEDTEDEGATNTSERDSGTCRTASLSSPLVSQTPITSSKEGHPHHQIENEFYDSREFESLPPSQRPFRERSSGRK